MTRKCGTLWSSFMNAKLKSTSWLNCVAEESPRAEMSCCLLYFVTVSICSTREPVLSMMLYEPLQYYVCLLVVETLDLNCSLLLVM